MFKKRVFVILFLIFSVSLVWGQTVIISEVTDPGNTANAKYVEIYNATDNSVDISAWEIRRYANGNTSYNAASLSGSINSGEALTVAYNGTEFNTAYGFDADFVSGSISGNGDDVYELYNGSSVVDIYGEVGVDGTDEDWEYENSQATRNSSIGTGNTTWTSSEWTIVSADTDDMTPGTHTCDYPSGGAIPPSISNIVQTPDSDITSSTTVSVSADVTAGDAAIFGVELHWGTTSGSLTNTINMSTSGRATYTTDSDIPAQSDGTTVYYEVYALDDDSEETTSTEQSYTVTDPPTTTLPYTENFESDLGDCYTYSVSGDTKEWYHTGDYAACNGYNSGDTEEDWLILPGINLDNYSTEVMTFDSWYKYGTDDSNNYLKLYYSTNYSGLGDPTGSSWTELTFTPPSASETWTGSGNVDLSVISGTSVWIAFEYHYTDGNYRTWEVDNINIQELKSEPSNYPTSFAATANGYDQVDLSWTDATGTTLPDGYLIKANETDTFSDPVDGTDPSEDTDLSDGTALVKVAHGAKGSYSFTSLTELTTYYFRIWSYTNSGTDIDFKTDGTVPTDNATTDETPADPSAGDLIISEICGDDADGNNNDNGFVEIYNRSGSSVLLDNVQVRYFNSNPGGPSSTFDLSGSIAAGEYIVITQDKTGFKNQYGFDADFEAGGNFYFNGGDDGVDIYLTSSRAEVLDEFNDNGADGTPFNWDDFKDYERTSTSVGNTLDSWTSNDGTGTPGAENDQTLPVTLSTFTVVFANEQPLLQWKTHSEQNNAGWNIYRGATEAAFTNETAEIINFEIIPGAGNSSEPTSYQFSDVFPVQPDASYYYWLESVSYSGATELYGPVTLEVPEDDIQGDTPDLPYKYGIQNYPNPFNPSTEISFVLPKASPVELNIYNLKGQKIRTLISGETLGKDKLHTVVWDGKDSNGQPASSGIYLYKLLTQDKVYSKKMLLVK
jgi:hypothetical protein